MDAAGAAPARPGVYLFVDAGGGLLYVGKATSLRARLRQHAEAASAPTSHLHERYPRVRAVRMCETPTEEHAVWLEADLIWALRPPFNAETSRRRRPQLTATADAPMLVVSDAGGERLRFALAAAPAGPPTRSYGSFPHLRKGTATRIGIACSDGYVAWLRLLWAAGCDPTDRMPAALTRAAPVSCELVVDPAIRRACHDLLSGVSDRMLDDLLVEARVRRHAVEIPALTRDRAAAAGFFRAGPRRVRDLRLRNRLPPGPLDAETHRSLVRSEIETALGERFASHPPD